MTFAWFHYKERLLPFLKISYYLFLVVLSLFIKFLFLFVFIFFSLFEHLISSSFLIFFINLLYYLNFFKLFLFVFLYFSLFQNIFFEPFSYFLFFVIFFQEGIFLYSWYLQVFYTLFYFATLSFILFYPFWKLKTSSSVFLQILHWRWSSYFVGIHCLLSQGLYIDLLKLLLVCHCLLLKFCVIIVTLLENTSNYSNY